MRDVGVRSWYERDLDRASRSMPPALVKWSPVLWAVLLLVNLALLPSADSAGERWLRALGIVTQLALIAVYVPIWRRQRKFVHQRSQ